MLIIKYIFIIIVYMSVSRTIIKDVCAMRSCGSNSIIDNNNTYKYNKTYKTDNTDNNQLPNDFNNINFNNTSLLLALNTLKLSHYEYNKMTKDETIIYYNEKNKLINSMDVSLSLKIILNYKLSKLEALNEQKIKNRNLNDLNGKNFKPLQNLNDLNENKVETKLDKILNNDYKIKVIESKFPSESLNGFDNLNLINKVEKKNNLVIETEPPLNMPKTYKIEKSNFNTVPKDFKPSSSNFKPMQDLNASSFKEEINNEKINNNKIDNDYFDLDNIINNFKKKKRAGF
jgi:hypothetical protein